jgi:hypothetical protein
LIADVGGVSVRVRQLGKEADPTVRLIGMCQLTGIPDRAPAGPKETNLGVFHGPGRW